MNDSQAQRRKLVLPLRAAGQLFSNCESSVWYMVEIRVVEHDVSHTFFTVRSYIEKYSLLWIR